MGSLAEVKPSRIVPKENTGDEAEGKYLTFMRVTGNLEVEHAEGLFLDEGLVFEEDGESLLGKIGQQVSFQHMPVETEGLAGRVIDSDKIDHPTGTDGLTPQNGES